MADLNFPKDRTELDPAGTGPLQTGDEYTANGTTWVYDATVGAWGSGASGESLSDLYISKVINDSAAGKITFEDTSIHENGIQVLKGGSGDSEKIYSKFGYDLYLGQNNASHPGGGAVVSIHPTINSSGGASMLALTGNDLTAATGASGYLFQVTSFNGSIGDDLNAFSCNDISDTADGLNIGYKGSVREGVEGKNYNAYFAAKTGTTAPIYSKGNVEVVGDVKLSSIASANFLGTDADGNIVASTAGDGLYLSKVNDDTAAGEITFEKRDVHKKGLAIKEDSTGKDAIFTIQGNSLRLTSSTTAGNLISASIDYVGNTAFNVNKKTASDGSTLASQSSIVSTFDTSNITIGGGNINSYFPPQSIASRLEYDGNTTVNTFSHFNVQSNRNPDLSGTGTPPVELTYYMAHGASIGINDPLGNTETSFDNSNVYAFRTTFNDGQAKNVFGLYSSGTAPSFHKGDFLVGGTPSLNTYELWKSTLTSLQLDELEAGTLVAPANVSLPGDGEFARQWWYDQQSAEDQALIDSGELEYPEHLAAATFTDTFALGDNTNIKLASSGTSEFKNDIRVDSDPNDATTPFTVLSRGQGNFERDYDSTLGLHRQTIKIGRSGGGWLATKMYAAPSSDGNNTGIHYNIDATNYYNSGGINTNITNQRPATFHCLTYFQTGFDNTKTGNQLIKYGYLSKTGSEYDQAALDPDNPDDAIQIGSATGFGAWNSGPVKNYRAFEFLNSGNEGINNTGFYSQLDIQTDADNWSNYHAGTAPSFFQGLTEHASGVSVTGGTRDPDVTSTTYPKIWSENDGYALYLKNRGLSPEAPGVEFHLRKPDDSGGGCRIVNDNNTNGTQKSALSIAGAWAGDYTGTGGSSIYKNAYLRVTADIRSSTTNASNPVLGVQSGSRVGPGNYWRCFHASRPVVGDVATEYIGYYTGIDKTAANTTYAIYAAGDSPSYFGGSVKIEYSSDSTSASNLSFDRNTANGGDASSTGSKIVWFNSGGAKKGKIEFDGAGGVNYSTSHSDYRAKENVVDLPSAVDKIKALRPVNFNFLWSPGKTRAGFIAHELKEVVPLCVSGEKDAVTRLGTMTFPDGTTKVNVEDISDEEAVPFGTTWEETHTEPDYQSVSHDHLIPILTKALQEALDKIETLETRLSDAGIA